MQRREESNNKGDMKKRRKQRMEWNEGKTKTEDRGEVGRWEEEKNKGKNENVKRNREMRVKGDEEDKKI